MRIEITLKDKDKEPIEGIVALKNESILILKVDKEHVRAFYWSDLARIHRINKGDRVRISINNFKR